MSPTLMGKRQRERSSMLMTLAEKLAGSVSPSEDLGTDSV